MSDTPRVRRQAVEERDQARLASAVEDLAEDLRLAVGAFVRLTRAHVDTLPRSQADTLGSLDRDGPRTIAQLAEQQGVRHQGMSRTVAELDLAGLVSRSTDPSDARASVISLTSLGSQALQTDRAARRDLLARLMREQLDDDERELLRAVPALLRKLAPPATRPDRHART